MGAWFWKQIFHPTNFKVNDVGEVCLGADLAVLLWSDNQWETLVEGTYNLIFLTRYQNFVASFSGHALYYSNHQVTTKVLGIHTHQAREIEPGYVEVLGSDLNLARWPVGSAFENYIFLDPLPGCPFEHLKALSKNSTGFYAAISDHSMVLQFPDDPHRADWKLVAGPCMHEICSMQVLEDGSVMALGDDGRYVMYYPPSGN